MLCPTRDANATSYRPVRFGREGGWQLLPVAVVVAAAVGAAAAVCVQVSAPRGGPSVLVASPDDDDDDDNEDVAVAVALFLEQRAAAAAAAAVRIRLAFPPHCTPGPSRSFPRCTYPRSPPPCLRPLRRPHLGPLTCNGLFSRSLPLPGREARGKRLPLCHRRRHSHRLARA